MGVHSNLASADQALNGSSRSLRHINTTLSLNGVGAGSPLSGPPSFGTMGPAEISEAIQWLYFSNVQLILAVRALEAAVRDLSAHH